MTDTNTGNGNGNTGHDNTGNRNTGYRNTGNWNTGNWNTGHDNTGNWNTGYRNTGNWNTGNGNTGFFMTTTQDTVEVFNGNATVDRTEFIDALPAWLWKVDPTEHDGDMHKAYTAAWDNSGQNWDAVEAIPGFDYPVWLEITGIQRPTPTPDQPADTIVLWGITYKRVEGDTQ